jgi:hypothetical protein
LTHKSAIEEAFQRVPISFYTVLVKREFLPRGTLRVAESSKSTRSLAAFVFMAANEAEDFVESLTGEGVTPGEHLGAADMMHGPLVQCDGVEYVWDKQTIPPCWTAFRVPSNSPD